MAFEVEVRTDTALTGKEQDNDIDGTGVDYDYGFRIYDARVGKFLSVDPLVEKYPWYTPYQFAGNKPIIAVDLDGGEEKIVIQHLARHSGDGEFYVKSVDVKIDHNAVFFNYDESGKTETAVTDVYVEYKGLTDFKGSLFEKVVPGGMKPSAEYDFSAPLNSAETRRQNNDDKAYAGNDPIKWAQLIWRGGNAPDNILALQDVKTLAFTLSTQLSVLARLRAGLKAVETAPPSPCFVAGTKILLKEGLKDIEDIKIGDSVWSEDVKTGVKKIQVVEKTFIRQTQQLIKLQLGSETIWTTPEHPFWIDQNWIPAKDIKIGDSVTSENNTKEVISNFIRKDTVAKVYNFTVANFHTYYVSRKHVLVHNACRVQWQKKSGMFGADFVSKKVHADVLDFIPGKTVELSFRLSEDGESIVANPVFDAGLKENQLFKLMQVGEDFLSKAKNRADLLKYLEDAKTTQFATDADRVEINKMIDILKNEAKPK